MSSSDAWDRLTELVAGALELPRSRRFEFLQNETRGDFELLRKVERYLAVDPSQLGFLEHPSVSRVESEDPSAPFVGTWIPPYVLGKLLGVGASGAVLLGDKTEHGEGPQGELEGTVLETFRDERPARAAIKLLTEPKISAGTLGRFFREHQALDMLAEDPTFPRIYEAGVLISGDHYAIVDFVPGQRIDRECRPLPLPARLRVFLEVCRAMVRAHAKAILHLDLKPENILVHGEKRVGIIDFGSAHLVPSGSDSTFHPDPNRRFAPPADPTTPEYASPEQLRGATASPGSDVYSLGVVLLELVSGHRPAPGEGSAAVRRSLSRSEAGEAAPLGTAPSQALEAVLTRALAVDPTQRYPSLAELTEGVRAVIAAVEGA